MVSPLTFTPVNAEYTRILPGTKLWSCMHGKRGYVIMQETKTGPGFEGWTGFTCSYKDHLSTIVRNPALYRTFDEAVMACTMNAIAMGNGW